MVRTQVYLTEAERGGLAALAEVTGKKQAELIREAVDRLIAATAPDRQGAILDRAAGLWGDRTDLPDFENLRRSWDRS